MAHGTGNSATTKQATSRNPITDRGAALAAAYTNLAVVLDGEVSDADAYILSRAHDMLAFTIRNVRDGSPEYAQGALRASGALLGEVADRGDLDDAQSALIDAAMDALALAMVVDDPRFGVPSEPDVQRAVEILGRIAELSDRNSYAGYRSAVAELIGYAVAELGAADEAKQWQRRAQDEADREAA